MKMRHVLLAVVTCCLLAPLAPASSAEPWSDIPIPPYAEETTELTILEGRGHQHSFVVDEPYPFDGVRDFLVRALPQQWVLCSSDATGWQDFPDMTQAPPVQVHQRLVHWFDPGRDRLLLLGLRYISTLPDPYCSSPPDNGRQLVHVVEYRDAKQGLELLDLQCPPHPSGEEP